MDVYIICKNNQYNLLTAWVRRQSKYGMASSFTSDTTSVSAGRRASDKKNG